MESEAGFGPHTQKPLTVLHFHTSPVPMSALFLPSSWNTREGKSRCRDLQKGGWDLFAPRLDVITSALGPDCMSVQDHLNPGRSLILPPPLDCAVVCF